MSLTFLVSSLQGGLNNFCGTAPRCNSLEWNGASKRRTRDPREAGIGQRRDAAIALHTQGGTSIPLRGRTFLRKALLRPARSHSASLRLALHPKNRSLHLVQLPDLG
ncbi:hypothetical protein SAMN05720354_11261 [Nitrosospira sp. Nsp1]|nr:hypothetical protein SAMN05720354_11261 [Nitrosospira sp. Nsp1]